MYASRSLEISKLIQYSWTRYRKKKSTNSLHTCFSTTRDKLSPCNMLLREFTRRSRTVIHKDSSSTVSWWRNHVTFSRVKCRNSRDRVRCLTYCTVWIHSFAFSTDPRQMFSRHLCFGKKTNLDLHLGFVLLRSSPRAMCTASKINVSH